MGGKLPAPDLSDGKVLGVVSGVRPCREGGMRLEAGKLGKRTIVHNYGHGGCGVTLSWGCAEIACDLLAETLPAGHVAVLGGGVVGLTTAVVLSERGYGVTVVAEHTGCQTTSGVAGALWLPTGIDFPKKKAERAKLNDALRRSAKRFGMLDRGLWGLEELPVYEPAETPEQPELFESGVLGLPRQLTKAEPKPGSIKEGRLFRTNFIHTPRFLRMLVETCENKGVGFESKRIASQADARAAEGDAVINCLGLGSAEVFGDTKLFPARGVLVHLEPQDLGYAVHAGYRYMFPREDALVLGGSFEAGESDTASTATKAHDILAYHREFFAKKK
jgi:glycine/D-amino acid oxidase-like deaminating enzyme